MHGYEFTIYPPGKMLGPYVSSFWTFEPIRSPATEPRASNAKFKITIPSKASSLISRLMPKADIGIVFGARLGASEIQRVITGCATHTHPLMFDPDSSMFGVKIKPGRANNILGADVCEFTDKIISLEEVWGSRERLLADQIADLTHTHDKLAAIEAVLIPSIAKSCGSNAIADAATAYFAQQGGRGRVSAFCNKAGISRRQLNRIFLRHVGVSPKLYCRIKRLHAAISALRCNPQSHWPELAGASGYYDQSHLITEFKRFVGVTPERFRADI